MKLKKCKMCSSVIVEVNECNCDPECISCCGEVMEDVKEVIDDEHTPLYYRQDNKVMIKVDHHNSMDHQIESIIIVTPSETLIKKFKYLDEDELIIGYEEGMVIYSLCNRDGLCKVEVK